MHVIYSRAGTDHPPQPSDWGPTEVKGPHKIMKGDTEAKGPIEVKLTFFSWARMAVNIRPTYNYLFKFTL